MSNILSALNNNVKHWYVPLIIGILFILLGLYIFSVPLATYITLAAFFSVSFWITGIADIFFAIENKKRLSGWGWYLVSGIISLLFGMYLTMNPGISMIVLPYAVGLGLLFRSAYMLGVAFDYRSYGVLNWGNVALTSALGLLLAVLLIASPVFTSLSLVYLTALSFIFIGIASVALAFDLKKLKNLPQKISDELKSKIEQLRNEVSSEIKK